VNDTLDQKCQGKTTSQARRQAKEGAVEGTKKGPCHFTWISSGVETMTNIALVGEAYGEAEEKARLPFIGAAGHELNKMLQEAVLHRADCFVTNVFNLRPKANKIEALCGPKAQALAGYPALVKSAYIRAEFGMELERLADELIEVNPNVVVALGNTAMWALTGRTAISKFRGSITLSTHCANGFKVLPTYHPAYLFKGSDGWAARPVLIADLQKAARESAFPEIRRPRREVWIEPTLEDIHDFFEKHIRRASLLSCDIETAGGRITCIGFAPDHRRAIVIPFDDPTRLGTNYWPSFELERAVWGVVKDVLETPKPPKLFQNGLYDIAFLYRAYGIKVAGAAEDTMLLHYSLQPESLKGLGFLGSVYCDESSWKEMREKKKKVLKRDD
jgi:uracil-DNA glycosylase